VPSTKLVRYPTARNGAQCGTSQKAHLHNADQVLLTAYDRPLRDDRVSNHRVVELKRRAGLETRRRVVELAEEVVEICGVHLAEVDVAVSVAFLTGRLCKVLPNLHGNCLQMTRPPAPVVAISRL
jgi:hypothetical protein